MNAPMTKTFRAPDMLSALQKVQAEFGSDAIVVSMREIPGGSPWQVWRRPMYEVVAMRNPTPKGAPAVAPASPVAPQDAQEATPEEEAQAINLAHLYTTAREHLRSGTAQNGTSHLTQSIQSQANGQIPARAELSASKERSEEIGPAIQNIIQQLRAHEIGEEVIEWCVQALRLGLPPEAWLEEHRVRLFVQRQLESGLRTTQSPLEQLQGTLFVSGISGSGKTTLCARLASYAIQVLQRRVAWITLDTLRTAALAEARTFTELLGLNLQVAYTPEEFRSLHQSLASIHDLILVDTPALNPQSEEAAVTLASFLTEVSQRKLYLVIPATAKESDMHHLIAVLSPFRIRALVFTKLDETNSLGSLYNLAWKSQIPVAFYVTGRRILDDLRPATASRLIKTLLGETTL